MDSYRELAATRIKQLNVLRHVLFRASPPGEFCAADDNALTPIKRMTSSLTHLNPHSTYFVLLSLPTQRVNDDNHGKRIDNSLSASFPYFHNPHP